MKNNNFTFLSVIFCLGLLASSSLFAVDATLQQQEAILEEQLNTASSADQITKITLALAQIKKQQSTQEFSKIPDMVGRERSFLSASVRDSLNFRQMASSFKNEPGKTSIAYSYQMGNVLSFCCILFGFLGLMGRLKYRY